MDAQLRVLPAAEPGGGPMAEAGSSFETFYQALHPRLFAALCLTTGSRQEAEEVMQDAFLNVWERWDRVSLMHDPEGFVFATAMNLFRKRYRRARLAARRAFASREPDDAFAAVNDRDELVRALRDLTPHQRAAIVLTALLDYSSDEAGRILGVKDSTVRVLAKKGRTAMRGKVGDVS